MMYSVRIKKGDSMYFLKDSEGSEVKHEDGSDIKTTILSVSSYHRLGLTGASKLSYQGEIREINDFDGEGLDSDMSFLVTKADSNGNQTQQ